MNKFKIIFFFIFLSTFICVKGQTESGSPDISLGYPVYSQYLQNGLLINPAYAGTRGSLSTFLSYRLQWAGIPNAPQFQSLSINAPMKNDKVGLGLVAQFMTYGYTKSQSLYASYAYHIKLRTGKLSLGIKGGFDRSNSDYSGILLAPPGDPHSSDPVFTNDEKPYFLPNVGAGAYYFSDKLFAGISIPAFLSYKKNTATNEAEPYHSFSKYDLVFSGGGLLRLSQMLKLKPSLLVDYSLDQAKKMTQFDINANLIYNDLIWLGASWRTTEKVLVGILQAQLNQQLMVGFSYDYPIGAMNYTGGSTEFILRYEFGSKVSAANPRYF